MCGITAISRVAERSSIGDPRQFMRLAALAIEPRGKDATGFAWSRSDGEAFYWKTPKRAQDATAIAPLDLDMAVAIGHTRWKTQGDVKDNRNNHPVIDDGIMLVHNGTVDNDYALYRLLGADYVKKADVDSQIIATMLVNRAAFDAVEVTDVLEVIEGSAALAWIMTSDPGTLHLARTHQRPLTIGWTRRGDLVMSSTPETLHNLSVWANVKIRDFWEVDEGSYIQVQEGEVVDHQRFTPKKRTYGVTTYYLNGSRYGSTTVPRSLDTISIEKNETLLSHDKPADKPAETGVVIPFGEGETYWDRKYREDYEAWWAAQEVAEERELAAAAAAAGGDKAVTPETKIDGRFVDELGLTWVPIFDGDEISDFVILDEKGCFIALFEQDRFAVEYDALIEMEQIERQLAATGSADLS